MENGNDSEGGYSGHASSLIHANAENLEHEKFLMRKAECVVQLDSVLCYYITVG